MNKTKTFLVAVLWALIVSGCGEVQVYDVDTKFSNVIQIEPVSKRQKTVFIRIKDITGYASELSSAIESGLKKEGYTIVTDPSAATFKLLVNVIKFGQGGSEDQITFMQAIDPVKAAELSIERNKVKIVHRNTNIYQKENSGYFDAPFGKRKNDIYANDEFVETNSIRAFADRTGIADVEIINLNGRNLKARIMVGVNMRGGVFVSPKPEVDHFGWTRLTQRLALAISSMF